MQDNNTIGRITSRKKLSLTPNCGSDTVCTMSKFARKFGIEIEAVGLTVCQAEVVLRRAGIPVFNGYTPESLNSKNWKVVRDGSVSKGFEAVSPVLSGYEGLAEVERVVKILRAAGAKINHCCGFHVHVDAGDLDTYAMKVAVRRYFVHETEIDKFMDRSRRGNGNNWARSMEAVDGRLTPFSEDIERKNFCAQVDKRYFKLNLLAFLRHGTLEFRQHHGSLDHERISNWIQFCVQFIEDCKAMSDDRNMPEPGLFDNVDDFVYQHFYPEPLVPRFFKTFFLVFALAVMCLA